MNSRKILIGLVNYMVDEKGFLDMRTLYMGITTKQEQMGLEL